MMHLVGLIYLKGKIHSNVKPHENTVVIFQIFNTLSLKHVSESWEMKATITRAELL
jgi:hypothetical protein